ncbi:Guanine exchange factor for Rac 30 [Pelomyxa schiedti]|nr:Guanine exchange factor for Rac 30 [Pelomyxa schiedti]
MASGAGRSGVLKWSIPAPIAPHLSKFLAANAPLLVGKESKSDGEKLLFLASSCPMPQGQEAAIQLFCILASDPTNGDAVRMSGGLAELVHLASPFNENTHSLHPAVAALMMVAQNETNQEIIANSPGFPQIVKLLDFLVGTPLDNVLGIVLALSTKKYIPILNRHGVYKAIVNVLNSVKLSSEGTDTWNNAKNCIIILSRLPKFGASNAFVGSGAVEALFEVSTTPTVLAETAIAVLNSLTSAEEGREAILESGLYTKLADQLEIQDKPDVIIKILKFLANLTVDPDGAKKVGTRNVIRSTIDVLRAYPPTHPVIVQAIKLLVHIMIDEDNFKIFRKYDGCDQLEPIIPQVTDPQGQECLSALLSNLLMDDSLEECIVESGLVKHMATFLASPNPRVAFHAARGIANLTTVNDSYRILLYDSGVVPILQNMVTDTSSPIELQVQALRAMTNLALCYTRAPELLSNKQLLPKLMSFFASNDPKMRASVASVFSNLTFHDKTRPQIVEQIGPKPIVQLLKMPDKETKLGALKVLGNMMTDSRTRRWTNENKMELAPLTSLEKVPDSDIQAQLAFISNIRKLPGEPLAPKPATNTTLGRTGSPYGSPKTTISPPKGTTATKQPTYPTSGSPVVTPIKQPTFTQKVTPTPTTPPPTTHTPVTPSQTTHTPATPSQTTHTPATPSPTTPTTPKISPSQTPIKTTTHMDTKPPSSIPEVKSVNTTPTSSPKTYPPSSKAGNTANLISRFSPAPKQDSPAKPAWTAKPKQPDSTHSIPKVTEANTTQGTPKENDQHPPSKSTTSDGTHVETPKATVEPHNIALDGGKTAAAPPKTPVDTPKGVTVTPKTTTELKAVDTSKVIPEAPKTVAEPPKVVEPTKAAVEAPKASITPKPIVDTTKTSVTTPKSTDTPKPTTSTPKPSVDIPKQQDPPKQITVEPHKLLSDTSNSVTEKPQPSPSTKPIPANQKLPTHQPAVEVPHHEGVTPKPVSEPAKPVIDTTKPVTSQPTITPKHDPETPKNEIAAPLKPTEPPKPVTTPQKHTETVKPAVDTHKPSVEPEAKPQPPKQVAVEGPHPDSHVVATKPKDTTGEITPANHPVQPVKTEATVGKPTHTSESDKRKISVDSSTPGHQNSAEVPVPVKETNSVEERSSSNTVSERTDGTKLGLNYACAEPTIETGTPDVSVSPDTLEDNSENFTEDEMEDSRRDLEEQARMQLEEEAQRLMLEAARAAAEEEELMAAEKKRQKEEKKEIKRQKKRALEAALKAEQEKLRLQKEEEEKQAQVKQLMVEREKSLEKLRVDAELQAQQQERERQRKQELRAKQKQLREQRRLEKERLAQEEAQRKIQEAEEKLRKMEEERELEKKASEAREAEKERRRQEREAEKVAERERRRQEMEAEKAALQRAKEAENAAREEASGKSEPTPEQIEEQRQAAALAEKKAAEEKQKAAAAHQKRTLISKELLTTEQSYVTGLHRLVWDYQRNLQAGSSGSNPIITKEEIKAIFSDAEIILNFHTVLLEDLAARIKVWDENTQIGDVFLGMLPFLKCYVDYINNYDNCLATLNRLQKSNKKFAKFVHRVESTKKDLPLLATLIFPIQRIPRYQLLLTDLLRHTSSTHPDHENLEKSLEAVKKTGDYLNEKKRRAESLTKMQEIQESVYGKDIPHFAEPHRMFVREGFAKLVDTRLHPAVLHLCNDMLIISRLKGKLKYQFVKSVMLDQLTLFVQVGGAEINKRCDADLCLQIWDRSTDTSVLILTADAASKQGWQLAIFAAIDAWNNRTPVGLGSLTASPNGSMTIAAGPHASLRDLKNPPDNKPTLTAHQSLMNISHAVCTGEVLQKATLGHRVRPLSTSAAVHTTKF